MFSGIVAITASYGHTCAANSTGDVYCWGNNDYGKLGTGDTNSRLFPTPVIQLQKGETTDWYSSLLYFHVWFKSLFTGQDMYHE
jgi:alpha-tubulin suppressor-like RCC1 family protein